MKTWIRNSLIVVVVIVVGLFGFYRFWMYPQYTVPILMYHYTGDGNGTLFVSSENFERQMKYLRDREYNIISLDDFVDRKKAGKDFSHNTVVITFDDGQRNNYINAFPVLKKYQMSATIFIITQWMGQNAFLTWDQVKEMAQYDIDFGSHTQHHVYLPEADIDMLRLEIERSKKDIEKRLGKPVNHLCYPSGGFTKDVKRLVEESGYLSALTTNRGFDRYNNDLYELMRIKVTNSDAVKLFHFWGKLSGYYNFFRKAKSGS